MDRVPTEFSKVQELVYELKIDQIMTKDVITVTPYASMRELRRILRERGISGVPVMEDDDLVGIVDLEDVVKALEEGAFADPVSERMTTNVQTVRADETVVKAVNLFSMFDVGRLPVVDEKGELVGVLTKSDIVRGLLWQMGVRWQAEEIEQYRASHIFEDIDSDETTLILKYHVEPHDFVSGGEASSKIKRALKRLGAQPKLVRRVALASYEAEMNVMIHSEGGEIVAEIGTDRIEITAADKGPGIDDVAKALEPGFSTAPDWIRELGFGAGMGLSNIKACSDEMHLESEVGVGTQLRIIFDLE
ncbi:MAG: CBS domain-containing protein [Anaerolineales bacterium]